jgi:hypothetical protein
VCGGAYRVGVVDRKNQIDEVCGVGIIEPSTTQLEYIMTKVITRGTEASYNDIFVVDAVENATGEQVRIVVHCRNLQSVMSYLHGYTPTIIR